MTKSTLTMAMTHDEMVKVKTNHMHTQIIDWTSYTYSFMLFLLLMIEFCRPQEKKCLDVGLL